jgi:hypothetical protein
MLKFSLWLKLAAVCLALMVSACGGGTGSSAAAPSGFTVTPGNGQVTVTWQASGGVDYWLMYAATSSPIDIKNPPAAHVWATNITSPYVITGLTNGVTYSFAMNGRSGGGAGGPQTASATVTPGYAGSAWASGAVMDASKDMRGLAYGTASDATVDYAAVGAAGAIFKGTDGATWSALTTAPAIGFKGVTYALSQFIAVGTSGGVNNVYRSADLATWTPVAMPSANGLNAVTSNGTTVVAVGDAGTIYYSTDALTWSTASVTGPAAGTNLYGVAYSSANGTWVAVGAGGALVTSTDLSTWTTRTSTSFVDLNGVSVTASNAFVAVGAGGKVISSADGTSWATQSLGANNTLYAVSTDSAQFLAVGQNGSAYTSLDGVTWTPRSTGSSNTLYAITGSVNRYVVVGQAGTNISSIN